MSSSVSYEYLSKFISNDGGFLCNIHDNAPENVNLLHILREGYGTPQIATQSLITNEKFKLFGVKYKFLDSIGTYTILGIAKVYIEDNKLMRSKDKVKLSSLQSGRVVSDSSISTTDPLYVGVCLDGDWQPSTNQIATILLQF